MHFQQWQTRHFVAIDISNRTVESFFLNEALIQYQRSISSSLASLWCLFSFFNFWHAEAIIFRFLLFTVFFTVGVVFFVTIATFSDTGFCCNRCFFSTLCSTNLRLIWLLCFFTGSSFLYFQLFVDRLCDHLHHLVELVGCDSGHTNFTKNLCKECWHSVRCQTFKEHGLDLLA